jgi:hypothetical protein
MQQLGKAANPGDPAVPERRKVLDSFDDGSGVIGPDVDPVWDDVGAPSTTVGNARSSSIWMRASAIAIACSLSSRAIVG